MGSHAELEPDVIFDEKHKLRKRVVSLTTLFLFELGVHRATLYRYLHKLGLGRDDLEQA